jgi:predicted AlkP superfamily phosphohydrolase/phosphomutase
LHHFFFDAAYDENHPYHTVFVDYYRMLDEFIGNFMNEIGNDTGFLSLSDHGFERLETQIYLNSLLQRLGFLSYRTPNPTSLEHVNPESMAVALDPTRIYLIHKGRFKESNRPESEAPGIRNRLKDALESITLEDIDLELEGRPGGASVFQEVHDSPVPFNTRFDYRLPDLICLPQKGIDVKAAIGVPYLHGKDIFTGTHTWDNAYLLIRDHHTHRIDYRPNIVEVAGIIRSMFNGRIPVHQRG